MVVTTTETLTVNGVVLNTLAKNIETLAGRLRVPSYRTENLIVPSKHGELWVPNKKFQTNTIPLPMWVLGCNDDGEIPSGSTARIEFYARVDELVTLFKSPGLLTVEHTLPDGSIRQCLAEVQDVLDFTTDASPRGLVGVILTVPDVFWQDKDEILQTWTGTAASYNTTDFRGGSAPIEDLITEVTGPWTAFKMTFDDGSWVQYNAALTAGQKLTIDSGEWELTGSGGLTPVYTNLTHDGVDAYWAAMPATAVKVAVTGTGRTTASRLTLRGRRKFLVG